MTMRLREPMRDKYDAPTFHSVSEQHLQRYVDEFVFRWNTREALGMDDFARASELLRGAAGKRLTYRRPDEAANA